MGGNQSLVMFPFPFSSFFFLVESCFVFSCSFQVFGSPKVGSKARDEMINDHFRGILSFPSCFSCSISLRELFCSSLGVGGGGGGGRQIVVESTLNFFSTL